MIVMIIYQKRLEDDGNKKLGVLAWWVKRTRLAINTILCGMHYTSLAEL